ncbi:hypothetical protein OIU91_10345 [Streptomyces sp. NBC_01456]|uniref:hypothetical protein n=1 Tax=unclassified Streptomyces TaxID=2593676 RepID=UPI002E30ACC9|nr:MULTISPECIES: hypothetical protein [unclassified Streptomyces]
MFDANNERTIEIQEQNAQRRVVRDDLKATPNKGAENRADVIGYGPSSTHAPLSTDRRPQHPAAYP